MFHNYICNIISSINKSEWSEFNKKNTWIEVVSSILILRAFEMYILIFLP